MTIANVWLIIKALLVIIPPIVEYVKNGKIKEANEEEILSLLTNEFDARFAKAYEAAKKEPVDEAVDKYNRSR